MKARIFKVGDTWRFVWWSQSCANWGCIDSLQWNSALDLFLEVFYPARFEAAVYLRDCGVIR